MNINRSERSKKVKIMGLFSKEKKATGLFFKGKTLSQLEKEMIKDGTSPLKDDELTHIAFDCARTDSSDDFMRIYMRALVRIDSISNSQEEVEKWRRDFDTMTKMLENNFK